MSEYFGKPNVIAEGVNADVDTTEEDVVVVTDIGLLTDTQMTVFIDYALGTNTSLKVRYYTLNEVGGSWYQLPFRAEATGILTDLPATITSASPASRVVDSIPLPACFGFKVTAQGTGGADSSITVKLVSRDN